MKAAFVSLFLCWSAAVHAASPPATQPGALGAVREVTLRNGLRLLLAPDTSATALDVAVWYDAGTTQEHPGRTGISHLFEHLMFGGSAHHGPREHNRLLQAEGGTANAYTTPDLTCFYETMPREALGLAFELEADRMASLTLTAQTLEAERRVVREEKRWRTRGNPVGLALQRLQALAYVAHPYRWPVVGLDEDLERITLEDCKDYYRTHYAPNNALITVVGDFDPDEALALARRTLETVPRRKSAPARPPVEPVQTSERRAWERADVLSPLLLAGWRTPPDADPDTPAFELIAYVLGTGPVSRLNRSLVVERPYSVFTQADFEGRRDSGLLYAIAAIKPGADSSQVESALLADVERLATEPIAAEELNRARRQLELQTLFDWQTSRSRARAIGTAAMVDGNWRAAAQRIERWRTLTPADVQRAAARVLRPAGRNLVWFVPRGPVVPSAQGGR